MTTPSSENSVDMDGELAQLLLEQERFLSQKKQPSARLSRFGSKSNQSTPKSSQNASDSDPTEGPQVLKGVVERHVTFSGQQSFVFTIKSTGFPVVNRRGLGQSVFGRRRHNAKENEQDNDLEVLEHLDQDSRIIDSANRAKIENMSHQEIAEAQQELLNSLDPELVEKFKSRKQKREKSPKKKTIFEPKAKVVIGNSIVPSDNIEKQRQKEEVLKSLASVTTEKELQEQALLLPAEERAKLDWTQSNTSLSRGACKNIVRVANKEATMERFDLDGKELTATETEVLVHSGLFHHGEDPNVAGYTMLELLHLARSAVASQRAMALNIVAKILYHRQLQQQQGSCCVPRVLPSDMALTLRMVLDDQNYTALSAGIAALHAFVVPIPDLSKDSLPESSFGTILYPRRVHLHPTAGSGYGKLSSSYSDEEVIYIKTPDTDDGNRLSDNELAAFDPVQALLRMDLGTRLWYILKRIQLPDQNAIEMVLDILCVVARHSPRAAFELSSNTKLVQLVQQQYIENDQVLAFENENRRALQLSLKALKLVRLLCQGQRSIASGLITSGVIQSTKGFLALNEAPTGDVNDETLAIFSSLQIQSLRIWRVLLGYGLDFHCFAYLLPVLSNFLVNTTKTCYARRMALFAALETFCRLERVQGAQHSFHQLGLFIDAATEEAGKCIHSLLKSSSEFDVAIVQLLTTILRFLATACSHTTKYHLETAGIVQVRKLIQSNHVILKLLPQLNTTVKSRELLVAIVQYHLQMVHSDLVCDLSDEVQLFERHVRNHLLVAATLAVASSSTKLNSALFQACELVVLVGNMAARDVVTMNTAFVQKMYHQALLLVERLGPGGENWTMRLFADVLFHPIPLQALGIFSDKAVASRMSRTLVPIYQALVNATSEQEVHSKHLFTGTSCTDKFSCHLRLPLEEHAYISSNLPLPSFWMVSPLSNIEYNSSNSGNSINENPSRAQHNEIKLIVSATCRFLFEFERVAPSMTFLASKADFRPEDKLFHVMHVFFAGSDVLFDDHVDAALCQLLPQLVKPIIHARANNKVLYPGFLKNFQNFESQDQVASSLSSLERQLLTFVEKLLAEFTATSFGNAPFAKCMTLFLTDDFPLEIRALVWKELQEAHLLHLLEPFQESSLEILNRCGRNGDVKLVQLMQQAVCKHHVSPRRGTFAYSVAIHHIVVYLFAERDSNTLSFARQDLAQTLSMEASPAIWCHLLSYDVERKALLQNETHDRILPERVAKLQTQAAFSSEQSLLFGATVASLQH
ncbi:hypothetical protein CCR75_006912 [Bremia lactucae]|uniref:RNA polymerase II-associated protein 1 n=1 Tax=Bremia lactucae TaxID=4779 RepID=A0A976NY97_BRELC|nr:hypothetical protein CCR75_006912 [Bremia lactucae]